MGAHIQEFVVTMAVLILAITLHEFAHAFSADRLGDPTPRRQGRISLLPLDHLDPIGTIFMAVSSWTGFGIGWGKPVMTNSGNFRNPRRDQAIVAAAGPISNLIQATVFAGIITLIVKMHPGPAGFQLEGGNPIGNTAFALQMAGVSVALTSFLLAGVVVNLSLAFFNLIPIAPLDGSWIMTAILPYEQAMRYSTWMGRYGQLVFLGLVFLAPGVLAGIIEPPMLAVARILLGAA